MLSAQNNHINEKKLDARFVTGDHQVEKIRDSLQPLVFQHAKSFEDSIQRISSISVNAQKLQLKLMTKTVGLPYLGQTNQRLAVVMEPHSKKT